MTTYVVKCELVAKESDTFGYQTLVFKNLDKSPFGHAYVMVVVFPRWESRIPDMNEIGYLSYDYVEAGIDTYFDRDLKTMERYNFTNLIFKKFVKERKLDNSKDIIL